MQSRLTDLRRKRAAGDSGFTLIELLVVVVIIGILIAIAIPVYLNYQKGAKDKSAASDLRNAISVLEQCNSDNSAYPASFTIAAGATGTPCANQTINTSAGTSVAYYLSTATAGSYNITATNSGGSGKVYCYVSAKGGPVATTTATITAASTTC